MATAQSDLAAKLVHENRFRRWGEQFARSLAQRAGRDAAAGLVTPVAGVASEMVRAQLREHFDLVMAEFSVLITDQLPQDLRPGDQERGLIRNHLEREATERSDSVAALHVETAQGFVTRAIRRAEAAAQAGEPMSMAERGQLVASSVLVNERASAVRLAASETQWAAERAKAIEVAVLLGQDGTVRKQDALVAQALKTWRSQGDSRVRTPPDSRFDHLFVDGQKVATDEPFTVSGERLLHPGDTSLGASSGNIVRCRCSAIYDVESVVELRRQFVESIFRDAPGPFSPTESDLIIGRPFDANEPE